MSLTYPLLVPSGQAKPFAVVTPTDHRAWILIAAPLGLCMTIISLGIRVFIRYAVRFSWGFDDIAIVIATVFALLQTVLVLAATTNGLGEALDDIPSDKLDRAQQLYYASNLFYVLSLGVSRVSTVFFFRRMTPNRFHVRCIDGTLGLLIAWTLASFLAIALQCDLAEPWMFTETKCISGWVIRWFVLEAVGVAIEIGVFGVAIFALVWKLQTNSSRKAGVVATFSLRLLIIVFETMRLVSLDQIKDNVTDITLSVASFACWTQAEMNFSIIAATIPMVRVFLASLPTKFGDAARTQNDSSLNNSSNRIRTRGGTNIQMESLRSIGSRKGARSDAKMYAGPVEEDVYRCVVHTKGNGNRVHEENADAKSVNSQGSQEMIIKKDLTWSVSYDQ